MGNEIYSALDIARFVINYSNASNSPVTNLKLQKLLYFIQAYFLTKLNRPCFSDDIEAWSLGPVIPSVYHEFKSYGAGNIPYIKTYFDIKDGLSVFMHDYDPNIISKNDQIHIQKIVNDMSKYSASTLVNITHKQEPWKKAYEYGLGTKVISNNSIKNYFDKLGD